MVPREQLLVWHPRDGWDPLCTFLGKAVPEGPFPKVNEGMFTATIFKYLLIMRIVGVLKGWAMVAAPAAVAGAAWWWYGGSQ